MQIINSFKGKAVKERNAFNVQIDRIIEKERQSIDRLINTYRNHENIIDEKACEFFKQETAKYHDYQKTYLKETTTLEFKLKELYEIEVNVFEKDFEKQKEQLNAELNNLNHKESDQIKQLDYQLARQLEEIKQKMISLERQLANKVDIESRSKLDYIDQKRNQLNARERQMLSEALENYQSSYLENQLRQYSISADMYSIFNDQYADADRIISNLSRNGINTAADIKGIDDTGRILKSNGTWVKVSEVANYRARRLEEWRQRKSRMNPVTPPQTLPYSEESIVRQRLSADYDALNEEEKKVRTEILQKKSTIPTLISSQISDAKRQEQNIINEIQRKKAAASSSFKTEKERIANKINTLQSQYSTRHKNNLQSFENKAKSIKLKLEELTLTKDVYFHEVKLEFDVQYDNLINELKKFDVSFKSEMPTISTNTINEMSRVQKEHEIALNNIITAAKAQIDLFNSKVNVLVDKQKNFVNMT